MEGPSREFSTISAILQAMLAARVDEGGRRWWDGTIAAADDARGLAKSFTIAARRAGKRALAPVAHEQARLARAGIDWPLQHWAVDDLARVALLVLASSRRGPESRDLVDTCYREGDNRERRAVLYALPLLPEPARFLDVAIEACRTHVQPVFEAIACENPYPARHFPEPSFNQMVLKAVFTGVALERIVGLSTRVTHELARMAADYASERRAAGRPVPEDLDLVMVAKGSER